MSDTLVNETIFYLSISDEPDKGKFKIVKETTFFNENADEADYSSTVNNSVQETVEYGDNVILLRMKIDELQRSVK